MAPEGRASHLEQVAEAAKEALERLDFKWAMIGGLAVSARSEPRFTRAVDLAVAMADDLEAEGLIRELQQTGYHVLVVLEQETSGRLASGGSLMDTQPDELLRSLVGILEKLELCYFVTGSDAAIYSTGEESS